jgi:adenine phosphoribosyltransferase
MIDLEKCIRDVPDFPKKGIIFKDITPLLSNYQALRQTVEQLLQPFESKGVEAVTGIESRGFIFGGLVAQRLGAGFVPIRKPGKLPAKTISESYDLEYGKDTVQMHADALRPGQKVLMIDDLLATGGTMSAACKLVERLGGQIVGVAFVVELCFLNGRSKLPGRQVHTLIKVTGE